MPISIPEAPVEGTVRLQGTPDARYQSAASPGLMGGAADPLIQAGSGLIKGGNEMAEAIAKIQERDDLDAVFKSSAQTKEKYLAFKKNIEETRRGDKARDVLVDTDKWFKDMGEEVGKTLTNDRQRKAYAHELQQLRITGLGQMADFESKQKDAALDVNYQVDRKATRGLAIDTPTPENIATQLARQSESNAAMLTRKGLLNEKNLAAANLEDSTAIHADIIRKLATAAPAKAMEWFKTYEKQIDPEKRDDLLKVAQQADDKGAALATSQEAWAKFFDPKTGVVKIKDMEDFITEKLGDRPDAMEKGIAYLRTKAQAFNAQRKAESDALEAGVNRLIVAKKPTAAILLSEEMTALSKADPAAARQIMSFLTNQDYTNTARAAAEESRHEMALYRRSLDIRMKYSNPDRIAQATEDEILNLAPTIGVRGVEDLHAKWVQYKKNPQKLIEARIDNELFNTLALDAGLRPNEKNKSEDEKNDMVRLRQRVEARIDAMTNGPGGTHKELSYTQKRDLMKQEVDDWVILKNRLLSERISSPDKVPVYKLNKDNIGRVDVPKNFVTDMNVERAKHGLKELSPEDAITLWIKQPQEKKRQYQPKLGEIK